jgi:ferredoxin-NADP reductase
VELVQSLVKEWKQAEYYMCGPISFLATLQQGLEEAGVDYDKIHFETF